MREKKREWFSDLIESKGAKDLNEIEHILKMKDEEYRMNEDLELREASEDKSLFAKQKLDKLKKRIEKDRFDREKEMRSYLAFYRQRKEEDSHDKKVIIGCVIFVIFAIIYLSFSGSSSKKEETSSKTSTPTAEVEETSTPTSTPKPEVTATPEPTPTPTEVAAVEEQTSELSYDELTDDEKALYGRTAGKLNKWDVFSPSSLRQNIQYEIEHITYSNATKEYSLPKDSYTEDEINRIMQAVDWNKACTLYVNNGYDSGMHDGCEYVHNCWDDLYPTKELLHEHLIEVGFTDEQANSGIKNCKHRFSD